MSWFLQCENTSGTHIHTHTTRCIHISTRARTPPHTHTLTHSQFVKSFGNPVLASGFLFSLSCSRSHSCLVALCFCLSLPAASSCVYLPFCLSVSIRLVSIVPVVPTTFCLLLAFSLQDLPSSSLCFPLGLSSPSMPKSTDAFMAPPELRTLRSNNNILRWRRYGRDCCTTTESPCYLLRHSQDRAAHLICPMATLSSQFPCIQTEAHQLELVLTIH